ncbi:hypothetical protein D9757_005225 [Collybiopsis confluens]|uniref:Uncharacterized protein n=1 Tax=Collybiopsis confluens TaxID=2823264 RepID=A0A8H5HVJ7_9AGAR|nr:hypothetical protein D9757_005225 [Collybiopsis confluens]
MSADQARRKAFEDSAASKLGKGTGPAISFIQHTLHLFRCFLSLNLHTRNVAFDFKAGGKKIDIDIIRADNPQEESPNPINSTLSNVASNPSRPSFHLNDRTLRIRNVHAVDNACPVCDYANRHLAPQDLGRVVCDCGAYKLIALVEDEVLADENSRLKQHLTTQRFEQITPKRSFPSLSSAQTPRKRVCHSESSDSSSSLERWTVTWDPSDGADSYCVSFVGEDDGEESLEVVTRGTTWSGTAPVNATRVTVYARCAALETQSSTSRLLRAPTPEPEPEPELIIIPDSSEPPEISDQRSEPGASRVHVPSSIGSGSNRQESRHRSPTPDLSERLGYPPAPSVIGGDNSDDNEPFRDVDTPEPSTHIPPSVSGEFWGRSPDDINMSSEPTTPSGPTSRVSDDELNLSDPHRSPRSSPAQTTSLSFFSSSPEPQRRRVEEPSFNGFEDLPDDYEWDLMLMVIESENTDDEDIPMTFQTSLSEITTSDTSKWSIQNKIELAMRIWAFSHSSRLDLPNWPEPSGANPPPTVRDVIADLAFKNNRGEMGKMSTDVTGYVSFKHMPPQEGIYTVGFSGSSGQKRDGIHNYLTGYKPFPLELFSSDSIKVDFGQPAKKIKVLPNEKWACIHPERQDVLTVRELARLMSYPDSFVFQGKLKDQYKLVGSSVCYGNTSVCPH